MPLPALAPGQRPFAQSLLAQTLNISYGAGTHVYPPLIFALVTNPEYVSVNFGANADIVPDNNLLVYLRNVPALGGIAGPGVEQVDVFTPTSGQQNFVLSQIPSSNDSIEVHVNGVLYEMTSAWVFVGIQTVQWNNVFFTLGSSDVVDIRYIYGGSTTAEVDVFNATNGQTSFGLSFVPSPSPQSVEVHVNGVLYENPSDWTVSSNTITWTNSLFSMSTSDVVDVHYTTAGPNDQVDLFNATNGQTAFVLTYTPNPTVSVEVHVNGILYEFSTDWTILGNTITWTNSQFSMSTTDVVDVRYTH